MATYTENYGLHQWESSDDFLRTDFNTDLAKIDWGMGYSARGAENLAYHTYHLMLAGKRNGDLVEYTNGIALDTFQDDSGIQAVSDGVIRAGQGLILCGTGQQSINDNYGNSVQVSLMDRAVTRSFTTTGNGILNYIQFYARSSDSNVQDCLLTLQEYEGETIFSQTVEIQANRSYTVQTDGVALRAGVMYQLTFGKCTAAIGSLTTTSRSAGYILSITPAPVQSGTMTAVSRDIACAGRSGLAWVRFNGGSVGLSLNGQLMEPDSQRLTVNPWSEPCTELSLRLDKIPQIEPDQLTAVLCLESSGKDLTVYDYGVAVF